MKNKFICLLLILATNFLLIKGQNTIVDSLQQVLKDYTSEDTTRVNIINTLASKTFGVNYEEALALAKDANNLANKLEFTKGQAESLKNIAFYYMMKSDFSESLKFYEQSLIKYKITGDKSKISLCYNNIGVIYKNLGDFEKALEAHKYALKAREEADDNYGISSSLTNIGVIYYTKGDYDKALEYYEKASAINYILENYNLISTTLNNIGVIYQKTVNYPKSLSYYQKALKAGEEINDDRNIANALTNIGALHYLLKDYRLALEYYQKAITITQKRGDKQSTANLLLNIGIIYENTDKLDESYKYYTDALILRKEIGDLFGAANSYNNLGSLCRRQNKNDEAENYYRKALEIGTEIESKSIISRNKNCLAQIMQTKGEYNNAYKYSKDALEIAQNIENTELQNNSAEVLSKSCAALGRFEEAYKYHVIFKQMADSLLNQSNIKQITTLENQYKFNDEKHLLEVEQELLQKENRFQKMVSYSFITGFILLLFLTTLIFRVLTQKRKSHKILDAQKQKIQKQAQELEIKNQSLTDLSDFKEDMTNMLVHDLKNPLSTILNIDLIPNVETRIKAVKNSGYIMLNMVQNMLDVYKYKSTTFPLKNENTNISNILTGAISEISILAEQKNISFNISKKTSGEVNIDIEIIGRVFGNLLSNAIKFATENSEITINIDYDKNQKVSIHNNGPHIPAENQEHIFEKFGQFEIVEQGDLKSTGLGLTFCKMAIEAHNGEIGVESSENNGVTFWFTLPEVKNTAKEENIENFVSNNKAKLELKQEEKDNLKGVYELLNSISVNQLSAFRKVISIIKDENLVNEEWISELENSVFQCNQTQYNELVNMIIE